MTADPIHFDFSSGKISGAGVIERIGLEIMRMGAFLSAPMGFVGFSIGAKLVRSVFRSSRDVRVQYAQDCIFDYPYGDGYWGVTLYNRKVYSPEVEPFLKSFADMDYVFIDCGSNYGYMSVHVTSKAFGNKAAIAIEADPVNYERTAHNAEINGGRYQHHHNAIYIESGKTVTLFGAKHEARSILEEAGGGAQAEVETLALKDLADWLNDEGNLPTILKLDVEGVEIDALKGAGDIAQKDCLIIYEEHGADKHHEISHYIKNELGMRLFLGNQDGSALKEISNDAQLDAMKTNAHEGYDLFAAKSELWLKRLEAFCDKQAGVNE